GYNKGNNYNQQLTLNYDVHWTATAHAGLDLNVTYEDGTQPLTISFFQFTENYSRVGISVGGSYQFTDHLGGSLTFAHWDRSSNIPGNNYSENSIALQLNYGF